MLAQCLRRPHPHPRADLRLRQSHCRQALHQRSLVLLWLPARPCHVSPSSGCSTAACLSRPERRHFPPVRDTDYSSAFSGWIGSVGKGLPLPVALSLQSMWPSETASASRDLLTTVSTRTAASSSGEPSFSEFCRSIPFCPFLTDKIHLAGIFGTFSGPLASKTCSKPRFYPQNRPKTL